MTSSLWHRLGRSANRRRRGPAAVALAMLLSLLMLGQVLAKTMIGNDGGGGYTLVTCWDGSNPGQSGCPPKPSLAIDATFTTSYTRTFYWTISNDEGGNYGGYFGDEWLHEYVISVDKTHSIDRRLVAGTIVIENPSTHTAKISYVQDEISGAGAADVDCGVAFPYDLPGGQDLTCSFSASLEGGPATNTAGVATTGNVLGNSGSSPITFPGSPTLINDEIDVEDNNDSWHFTDNATVSYDEPFDCFGESPITNTATIVQTGQSDSATVTVTCISDTSGLLIIDNYTYPEGGLGFDYVVDPDFVGVDTTFADPSPAQEVTAAPDGKVYVLTNDDRVLVYQFDDFEGAWYSSAEFNFTNGSGPGDISFPSDIAVDGANNIYLADYGNDRVQVFDHFGDHVMTIGGPGSGKGQFHGPSGLAFDAENNLYVVDSNNDRIQMFNELGSFVAMWGKDVLAGNAETGFEVCTAAPADTCQGNNQGDGPGEFYAPFDVAVYGNYVYVAELGNARVQKFTRAGDYLMQWGSFGSGDSEFDGLGSLAVDTAGAVYTVEYNNHRIQKFTGNGEHIVTWGGPTSFAYSNEFHDPTGIAFEPLGYGFVVDQDGAAVKSFFAHGARLNDGEQAVLEFSEDRAYDIYPLLPDGWSWVEIDCDDSYDDNGDSITVDVGPGDIITCGFGHETDDPGTDLDGVPDNVEDGAPNGGDGNNDGILDSQQNNVTLLPYSGYNDYVTVVSEPGRALEEVKNAASDTMPVPPPAGVRFTTGVHTVKVDVGRPPRYTLEPEPPQGAVLTLHFDRSPKFDSYYKFGPTPDNPTPHWYEFLYDGETGVEILGENIVVHLVDGGRGDSDLMVNGVIVDPGGPVVIDDAELTIVKEVAGDVPADWSFDFTGDLNSFSLTDDDPDITYAHLTPGDVEVTETDLPGWIPSVSCLPGGESGVNSVTVTLEANEVGTCRFVNTICAAGTYDDGASCVDAPAGSHTPSPGASVAYLCPLGSYQPNTGQPGCFVTDAGYYVAVSGAVAQIACELGTYQPDEQQSACLVADANYYVDTTAATAQTACPAGTTSPAGSDSLDDCVSDDTTPPDTTILTGPTGTTSDNDPAFTFSSTEPGGTFMCKLDANAEEACDGGSKSYSNLADGPHTFAVYACDAAGNCDASPASRSWTIDTSVPPAADDLFMSANAAGTTSNGVAFGPEDILRWNGTAWSLFFDGSAAGLENTGKPKHNIDSFWIPNPNGDDVVMSFGQNRRHVPDITQPVDGMDLVLWNGTNFSFYFDGSDVDLISKTQEKIDGLHVLPGSASPIGSNCIAYLLISTQGPGKVKGYDGKQIKFSGEDVLGFCANTLGSYTTGKWHMMLDGSTQGLAKNVITGISVSDDMSTLYLTSRGIFNVDGAFGGHSMVYAYDFATQLFRGPLFSAPANGLPQQVDGLEVVSLAE